MQNLLESKLIRYIAPRPRESPISALLKTAGTRNQNWAPKIRALRDERKDLMRRQGLPPIDSGYPEVEMLRYVDADKELRNIACVQRLLNSSSITGSTPVIAMLMVTHLCTARAGALSPGIQLLLGYCYRLE